MAGCGEISGVVRASGSATGNLATGADRSAIDKPGGDVAPNRHGKAPHKPLLLLCLLDMAEAGEVTGLTFTRTAGLVLRFKSYGPLFPSVDLRGWICGCHSFTCSPKDFGWRSPWKLTTLQLNKFLALRPK